MTCSIIITAYNRRNTLPKALESAMQQTYRDVEIIVVDDGSQDGTDAYMKNVVDSRVRYVKMEKNEGASAARNRGIQEARGEYILVWDSDDALYPGALEEIMTVFQQHPEYAVVSAPARVMSGGKEVMFQPFSEGDVVLADILTKKLPSNEKVRVARAAVMKQVSYKSRNIDFLVNVELIERGTWFHIDAYLGDVFNNPEDGSLTSVRRKRNMQRSMGRAPHLVHFLEKHGEYLKKISPSRYADYCFGTAIGLLFSGDIFLARRYARDAALCLPTRFSHWGIYALAYVPGGARLLQFLY